MKEEVFDRVKFWTEQIMLDHKMIAEFTRRGDEFYVKFWEDQLKKDTENLNYNGESK